MAEHEQTKAWQRANALAWWLASTLARRNSRLIVWEHAPLDGFYDCLGVRDSELTEFGVTVDLNRRGGSVHVHSERPWKPVRLLDMLGWDEPFEMVRRVEETARWQPGRRATTPRSLTYRVIAHVLQSVVDDQHRWDARMVVPKEHWGYNTSYPEPAVLGSFPEGSRLLETLQPGRTMFHGAENIWLLTRDDEPIAALDTDGRIVVGDQPIVHMMPIFEQHGRRVAPVVANTLARMLP